MLGLMRPILIQRVSGLGLLRQDKHVRSRNVCLPSRWALLPTASVGLVSNRHSVLSLFLSLMAHFKETALP
jgi:hypothetical protein